MMKWFFWLMVYSFIGWAYETALCSAEQRKFVNRGFLNGCLCPIYGFGALIDIAVLGRIENPLLLFVYGVILTCSLEYITSWGMETLFHARWWDYSDKKFNINGRVCLIGAVVFGLFSVVLIKFIHPFVVKITNTIQPITFNIVVTVLFVVFVTDITITLIGFSGFNKKLKALSDEIVKQKDRLSKEYRDLLSDKLKEVEAYRLSEKFKESEAYKLSEKFRETEAYKIIINFKDNINHQERRMIKAFPKLSSNRYNDALVELKSLLSRRKK